MRYCIVTRKAKIKKDDNTKCCQERQASETLLHCWWECKKVQKISYNFLQNFLQFLTMLNMYQLHDPAVLLLGIYSREMKTCVHKKLEKAYKIFIETLFIIAQNWKIPTCPSTLIQWNTTQI